MNVLEPLEKFGVTVKLSANGKLNLAGQAPCPEAAEYAKRHREEIVKALSKKAHQDWPSYHRPEHLLPLPDACPLEHGGFCPDGCRFTTDSLVVLIKTGVMPDPKKRCLLRQVCGLFSEWPRTRPESPPVVEEDTPSPEPESVGATCDTCPAWDAESQRCYSTAYFEHKAGPWYIGEDALKKCPRNNELPLPPSQRR